MAGITYIKTASGAYVIAKKKYVKTGSDSYAQIKEGYVKAVNPAYRGLPAGYTQVEYIGSSGTQYIDTGVTPSATDNRIRMDYTCISTSGSLFGSVSDGKDVLTFNSGKFWQINTSPFGYTITSGVDYTIDVRAKDGAISATLNGEEKSGTYNSEMSTGATFYLFAQNNTGTAMYPSSMKCRHALFYVDDVLVRDFVPCTNPSGEAGLYDMVGGTFYANAGTGAFAVGSEVQEFNARLFYNATKSIAAATVTLGANLTYNGSSQTKAVTVVLDGVTLVAGTDYTVTGNTGTNADSYTMTITGIGDYEGTFTQEWSIAKATGSISVSPTTLSITGAAGTTKTATISYTGDGSISVSSSATAYATATRSGNTITVTLVATGSATITITLGAGTNYTGASCTIGVTTKIPVLSYYGTATNLSVKRYSLGATTVGNYALFGGGTESTKTSDGIISAIKNTVDAYNTSLTRSTPTALSGGRCELAATTVGNYALFGGGDKSSDSNDIVDAYDESLTRSTPTALSAQRGKLAATTVGNYALFGGGHRINYASYNSTVDAYDASLTRSTPTALNIVRRRLAATTVGNYALFGGGETVNEGRSSAVDVYDTSLTRSTATRLDTARYHLAATTVGSYALFGGGYYNGYKAVVDAYDASLTRSTPTALSGGRCELAATTVGNYALFGGGSSSADGTVVDAYDTSLTRSTPTALSASRSKLAATTVGNYALFGGGYYADNSYATVDAYQYA